ncbi:hypothetical protein B0H17DRAFT_1133460 [Mycena rosella]|uniref:Uncharacterized protein n=1 Tax=Mycena rosella TaxID=1033263 RepID=A0AAD7DIA8_MYCRO|nr:hypothetical protein B0H17DRAFT_1133460 [Mycena rosella]
MGSSTYDHIPSTRSRGRHPNLKPNSHTNTRAIEIFHMQQMLRLLRQRWATMGMRYDGIGTARGGLVPLPVMETVPGPLARRKMAGFPAAIALISVPFNPVSRR